MTWMDALLVVMGFLGGMAVVIAVVCYGNPKE